MWVIGCSDKASLLWTCLLETIAVTRCTLTSRLCFSCFWRGFERDICRRGFVFCLAWAAPAGWAAGCWKGDDTPCLRGDVLGFFIYFYVSKLGCAQCRLLKRGWCSLLASWRTLFWSCRIICCRGFVLLLRLRCGLLKRGWCSLLASWRTLFWSCRIICCRGFVFLIRLRCGLLKRGRCSLLASWRTLFCGFVFLLRLRCGLLERGWFAALRFWTFVSHLTFSDQLLVLPVYAL